jgi:hypothetical protein
VVGGNRNIVAIPDGAVVKVISGPTADSLGLVNVKWEGRTVAIFSLDLKARGTEIADRKTEGGA